MARLAMIQMRVDGGDAAANRKRALDRIESAARQGATIAVLPEALNLGWTHPSASGEAESISDSSTLKLLSGAAKAHRMWICFGMVERDGPCVFNAAFLLNAAGEIVLRHRKIHELDIGRPFYSVGDRLGVAESPWGRIGIMICADGFAPGLVISRSLGLMGARIILSPCAWAVPADPYGRLWQESYGPVAQDFQLWIAGVSNVGAITAGPWAGRKCNGGSLLVGPTGDPFLQGDYGDAADAILMAELSTGPVPIAAGTGTLTHSPRSSWE